MFIMMKSTVILRTSLFASLFFLKLASAARGQQDPNLGRAAVMQAEAAHKQANAAIVNAAAAYEKAQAEIARLHQDTYENAVQNDLLEAEIYYKKRAAYHAYQATQRPKGEYPSKHGTQARTASTVRTLAPQQLARPSESLRWPTVFHTQSYDTLRRQVDSLLAQRTPKNSGAGSLNCVAIVDRLDALKRALRENIRRYSALDYLAARNFVEAIAAEAQKPVAPRAKETLDKVAGH
jgi:hypothetical protein